MRIALRNRIASHAGGHGGVGRSKEMRGRGSVGIEGDSNPGHAGSARPLVGGWPPGPLSRSVCSPSFRLSDVSILDIGYTRLLFVAANGHWHHRIPAYDLLLCFRRMLRRPSDVPPLLLVPLRFLPISLRAPFARSTVRTHPVLSLVMSPGTDIRLCDF